MSKFKIFFYASLISGVIGGNDHLWHSYKFGTGYGNREEFVVTKVTANDSFESGHGVHKWKSITVGPKAYAFGLLENGVTVLEATLNDDGKFFQTHTQFVELNATLTDIILFDHWNKEEGKKDIIVVISSAENPLKWFKLNDNIGLTEFWQWNLNKLIYHMNFFELNDRYMLLVANNASADLYEFVLNSKLDFWLCQVLSLSHPINHTAVSTFGQHYYISIPQTSLNLIQIYRYTDNRFIPFQNLSSDDVDYVINFKIGFKSFIGINGRGVGIYQFTKFGLIKKAIKDFNADEIEFWYPVYANNYRDDIILIVQSNLYHSTHESVHVAMITYDGKDFTAHEEVPCSFCGEEVNGLDSCLPDEERENGVKGMTVLRLQNHLGILVPRKKLSSGLFIFTTEMKKLSDPVNTEISKLQALKLKLEEMIQQQEDMENEIRSHLQTEKNTFETDNLTAPLLQHKTPTIWTEADDLQDDEINLEEIEENVEEFWEELNNIKNLVSEAEEKEHFKTIIIDGPVEIQDNCVFNEINIENLNEEIFDEIIEDIVRLDDLKPIQATKQFVTLNIQNLTVQHLNTIKADKIAFKDQNNLIIKGDLIFLDDIDVSGDVFVTSGKINDIILEKEIVSVHKIYNETLQFKHVKIMDTLETKNINKMPVHSNHLTPIPNDDGVNNIESLEIDTIYFPGDVIAENINGENTEEFLNSLCLKNIKIYIPGTTKISGNLIAQKGNTNYLNNLQFPEEYVLINSNNFIKITGKKTFNGNVLAKDLVVHDLINNIKPDKIITLTNNQTLPGKLVLTDLELTESLTVDGDVMGEHVNDFLPNPTFLEKNILNSNLIFQNLEVEGTITLSNDFNGSNYETILENILYKNEINQVISGVKEFTAGLTVRNNLNLDSNAINNIPLDSFITKNTEQTIEAATTLNGFVHFDNLELQGLYGGVNVTELDESVIKLTGEQFVSSTLIFEDEIAVDDLMIMDTLNDLESEYYYYTDGDREFTDFMEFGNVQVDNINVDGNLNGTFVDFDLEDFEKRRLSFSKDQNIVADCNVKNLQADDLEIDLLNDFDFDELFNPRKYEQKIAQRLSDGKYKIKNLYINGSLILNAFNGIDMEKLIKQFVWKNSKNNFNKTLIIQGNVNFKNVDVKTLSGVNLNKFIQNLIFKNETNLTLKGYKIFNNGFHVNKYMEVDKINEVPVENVLRKSGGQVIAGPIIIKGNVIVKDKTKITENINDMAVEKLKQLFEVQYGIYKINADVTFSHPNKINQLEVEGFVNGVKINTFMEGIVFPKENFELQATINFAAPVTAKGNLAVTNYVNNIDLLDFYSNTVSIVNDDTIEGTIIFKNPVLVNKQLEVEGNLQARYIYGIDLKTWNDNAVFIDRGQILGNVTFEQVYLEGNLKTQYINEINTDKLIMLQRNEFLNEKLDFLEITALSEIDVGYFVNGLKLQEEYQNTLLSGFDQTVTSSISFWKNVVIRQNLYTYNTINNYDLTKLVTTNTDQNLLALYNFYDKSIVESNLYCNSYVNNLNFSRWVMESAKTNEIQNTFTKWSVKKNITFEDDVKGNGLVGGVNLAHMAYEVQMKKEHLYYIEKHLLDNYREICYDVNYILAAARNQIYFFKHLELRCDIYFDHKVETTHYFKEKGFHYLLVTTETTCQTHLFKWINGCFRPISSFITGSFEHIISLVSERGIFFVTRSKNNSRCSIEGTYLWQFYHDGIQINLNYVQKLEDLKLLQDSLIPETFYGLSEDNVIEFKLAIKLEIQLVKYRKWKIVESNLAFIPRGLRTGLAMRNGYKLFKLLHENSIQENDYGYETEATIVGNVYEEYNKYLPGANEAEILTMIVGIAEQKRILVAVASHEETSIKRHLDLIKIYENVISGVIFHNIPSYKPSSLLSLEFSESGETLLLFLEDGKILQIYEYKGIEGFKHKASAKLEGTRLFALSLPDESKNMDTKFVGLVNKNKISIIEAVMYGNQLKEDDLVCEL